MKSAIIFFAFVLLGILINFLPIQTSYLPYIGNFDANTYVEKARNIDLEGLKSFSFFEFALGALNWFSLPLLLKLIDIESGYWRMMLINAVILFGIVRQLDKLAKKTIVSNTIYIGLSLLFMPFLWCWIFIPSKENIAVLGFLVLFNYYLNSKKRLSLLFALFLGLFKTQIIACFLSAEVLKRFKKRYFIFSLLVINFVSILVYMFFEEALSVELYLSHLDEEINTSGVILLIEKVIKTPILGIVGVLMRLVLYIPAGVSAAKDLFFTFEGFLMNFSSVMAGLLSWIFLLRIRKIDPSELRVFWSLLTVFLFIPFIQFRYFWWTIPIFLYFIFRKPFVSGGQPAPVAGENMFVRPKSIGREYLVQPLTVSAIRR